MRNKNNNLYRTLLLVVLALALVGVYYFFLRDDNLNWQSENFNQDNNSQTGLSVEREYEGKLVYAESGSEAEQAAWRSDCDQRGGTFNECGNACEPGAVVCTQVCAYTCTFEDGDSNSGQMMGDISYIDYQSNDLGFSTRIAQAMEVDEEASNRLEFMYKGENQKPATELYDGVRILLSRLSYDSDMSLEDFAISQAQESPGINDEVVAGVSTNHEYDFATFEYTKESMGTYQHYVAMIYPGEAFDIAIFVSDNKYREIADTFLANFEITDSEKLSTEIEDVIMINSPQPGLSINSPISISGQAVGNWFFEAQFSIDVVNWDGLIVGTGIATAQGEWMTENMVPFIADIEFDNTGANISPSATLIFHKANPSGLPQNDMTLEYPVYFDL